MPILLALILLAVLFGTAATIRMVDGNIDRANFYVRCMIITIVLALLEAMPL